MITGALFLVAMVLVIVPCACIAYEEEKETIMKYKAIDTNLGRWSVVDSKGDTVATFYKSGGVDAEELAKSCAKTMTAQHIDKEYNECMDLIYHVDEELSFISSSIRAFKSAVRNLSVDDPKAFETELQNIRKHAADLNAALNNMPSAKRMVNAIKDMQTYRQHL